MSNEELIAVNSKKKIQQSTWITGYLVVYDLLAVSFAYFAALWLRFDLRFSMIQQPYLEMWAKFAPWYAVFCIVIFAAFKLYKSIWRFASFKELQRITLATAVTTVCHLYGTPAKIDEIRKICKQHDALIVPVYLSYIHSPFHYSKGFFLLVFNVCIAIVVIIVVDFERDKDALTLFFPFITAVQAIIYFIAIVTSNTITTYGATIVEGLNHNAFGMSCAQIGTVLVVKAFVIDKYNNKLYTIAIFTINRTLLIKHKTQGFISAQRDDFRRELERQRHNQMSARILKHDIDNYINSVKKLIEEGEYNRANKILDDLSDRNKVIAPEIFSEDTLINSILVEYSQRADIANVKFQCECRISEPIAINDLDLSAVLFNGLDNALESSEKIEDPDKRMIDVNIFTSMGYLIVRIKNTYDARPIIKNNHIASTKIRPGESHGNGLFSMDLIAKKYFGKKNIYVEGQFVALYVILKNISLPES